MVSTVLKHSFPVQLMPMLASSSPCFWQIKMPWLRETEDRCQSRAQIKLMRRHYLSSLCSAPPGTIFLLALSACGKLEPTAKGSSFRKDYLDLNSLWIMWMFALCGEWPSKECTQWIRWVCGEFTCFIKWEKRIEEQIHIAPIILKLPNWMCCFISLII